MTEITLKTILVFAGMTLGCGGLAAWAAGRAVATLWQSYARIPFYTALLALVALALGHLLFHEPFTAARWIVSWAALLGFSQLGYLQARTELMARMYPWLYSRTSPLSWQPTPQSTLPADDIRRNSGENAS